MRHRNISASELGQYIHDELPRTFDWIDIDGATQKTSKNTLRIIEQKNPGQRLKGSQRRIFSKLAKAINFLICERDISENSGVFIVWTEPPYSEAIVSQVYGCREQKLILEMSSKIEDIPRLFQTRTIAEKLNIEENRVEELLKGEYIKNKVMTSKEFIEFISEQ